jgi:hypothetical protein
MEKRSTFWPVVLFGFGTGVVMVIFSLVFFLLNIDEKSFVNSLVYIILVAGMFWGMYNIRENRLNGVMKYGKAVGTGFWIGFVASLVVAVYYYYYLSYLNPAILDNVMAEAQNKILEQNPDISEEDLDRALYMIELFSKPYISAIVQVFSNSFISIIFSLIIAIFVKREDRTIA